MPRAVKSDKAGAATEAAPDPRGRKPLTSREAILDSALDLVDREGLAALNVRRVTNDLEIGPMTLYGYFDNKEGLIDAMIERALPSAELETDPALTWQQRLSEAMRSMHAGFERHPGVIELVMSRSQSDPVLDRTREALIGVLLGAGFDARESVDALRMLIGHALGSAILTAFQRPSSPDEARERLRELDRKEFPHLRKVAAQYARPSPEQAYDRALEELIGVLERRLEA